MNNPITYGKIFKRYRCLNNTKMPDNYYNPSRLLENVEKLVERKANDKIILNSIQEGITDVSNSNINEAGFGYITRLISTANNIDSQYTFFTNEVTENVIPYLLKDRLEDAKFTIEESDLQDWQKDTLLNGIKETTIIDRILNNHATIAKRFNLDNITESKNLNSIVESVCTMIDTYDVPIYQKLNLAIEEMTYLLGKNNIKYDNKDLVEGCTNFYLLSSSNLSKKDISNIRTTLQESYCISEDDTKKVSFIFEDNNELESIGDYIDAYLLKDNKCTLEIFNTFSEAVMHARDTDLLYHLSDLIEFVYDAYIANDESYNKTEQIIKSNFDAMFAVLKTQLRVIVSRNNIEYLSTLRSNIEKTYNSLSDKYNHLLDNNRRTITEYYLISIKEIIELIDELLTDNYPESNLEAYNYITRENADHINISVAESKSVGLLKSVTNFNSKWKEKSKQFAKKVHAKFIEFPSDMKKFIIGETTSLASLITEDKRLDCTMMKMILEDGSNIITIHNYFNSLCEEYNLLTRDGYNRLDSRAYYIISNNIAELHIAESSIIDIDDKDVIFNDLSDPMLLQDVKNLNEVASFCDYILENLNEISNLDAYLATKLNESNTPISVDEYELVMEALSIMNAPETTIQLFTEKYLDSLQTYVTESNDYSSAKYTYESSKIKTIKENYKPYSNASIEEYAFCTGVLSSILEKKDESLMDKDRKLGEDIKKKNPLKGINFNGIKLVLQGIKNKFRNLSTKEKELSTKIDNNFKNFVSSIKKASVDKKREQIIKNDVVPSLSKCIKTGILLAGVGVFGNPILAAALAIGSFAANRKITAKEKTLICDEIETELQVIDREIANADARNQTKRYRALLTQKKALQREYQRIKYNKNIGKKFYVSPNAGTQVES